MIVIDSEFQSLIPPLADDEYDRLEKSILEEGFHEWEPIVTWNGTIVDGHNRYNICDEHGIPFKQIERDFPSREAAKIWIIEKQLGRRNLTSGQKAALVIDQHEAEVKEQARLRQAKGRPKKLGPQGAQDIDGSQGGAAEPAQHGRTADILAGKAGVGHMTIKRALKVKREDPELYDKVRKGDIPVTSAYKKVSGGVDDDEKKEVDTRRICTICGKPINEGEHYQDKLNWHYQCGLEHATETQRKYRDADRNLRENVPTYTIDSLLAELTASADSLSASWDESVSINESMGVSLTGTQKKMLKRAVTNLFKAIEKVREAQQNG